MQAQDVRGVSPTALHRVALHDERALGEGRRREVGPGAPGAVGALARRLGVLLRARLPAREQARLARHVEAGQAGLSFRLVVVGAAHAHRQLAGMRRPDRLEALPLLGEGDDDGVHRVELRLREADAAPRRAQRLAVRRMGVARVVGALGVGAPAALRAALEAHVGPLLRDGAHLGFVVGACEDARARLAPLACGEIGRALLAGGAARLALLAPGAPRGGALAFRELPLLHGPMRLGLPGHGRGADVDPLGDRPRRIAVADPLLDHLPVLLGEMLSHRFRHHYLLSARESCAMKIVEEKRKAPFRDRPSAYTLKGAAGFACKTKCNTVAFRNSTYPH